MLFLDFQEKLKNVDPKYTLAMSNMKSDLDKVHLETAIPVSVYVDQANVEVEFALLPALIGDILAITDIENTMELISWDNDDGNIIHFSRFIVDANSREVVLIIK
ncbi:hypothetical protein D3C81_11810 [compost metagenome]